MYKCQNFFILRGLDGNNLLKFKKIASIFCIKQEDEYFRIRKGVQHSTRIEFFIPRLEFSLFWD